MGKAAAGGKTAARGLPDPQPLLLPHLALPTCPVPLVTLVPAPPSIYPTPLQPLTLCSSFSSGSVPALARQQQQLLLWPQLQPRSGPEPQQLPCHCAFSPMLTQIIWSPHHPSVLMPCIVQFPPPTLCFPCCIPAFHHVSHLKPPLPQPDISEWHLWLLPEVAAVALALGLSQGQRCSHRRSLP